MSLFFAGNDRVRLSIPTPPIAAPKVDALGNEILSDVTPPAHMDFAADIQPYSDTTEGGVFANYPEQLRGNLYRVFLPLTKYTRTLKEGDYITVVSAHAYDWMVGKDLAVVKPFPRGKMFDHFSVIVRYGLTVRS